MTPGSREASEDEKYRRRRNSDGRRSREENDNKSRSRKSALQPPRPSAFLAIQGLPEDVDEEKLRLLFAPIPGILNLTLWTENKKERKQEKDDSNAIPPDFLNTATLEMASMAASGTLLASQWKDNAYYDHHRLSLEYQHGILGDGDWMCTSSFCSTIQSNTHLTASLNNKQVVSRDTLGEFSVINYAWRSQCYKCHAPRTPACPVVAPESEEKQQEQALLDAGWELKTFDDDAVDVVEHAEKGKGEEDENKKEKTSGGEQGDEYEYDSVSGYLKHTRTGYLYDSSSGMYFHPQIQKWGTLNVSTGEFEQYKDDNNQKNTEKDAHAGGGGGGGAGDGSAVSVKTANAVAVIGAAPQIDKDALRLAEEERKERKLQEQQQQQEDLQNSSGGDKAKSTAAAGPGSSAPSGQVKGVLHRGKWAQRRAAAAAQQQEQPQ
jgi:hypothetical protein